MSKLRRKKQIASRQGYAFYYADGKWWAFCVHWHFMAAWPSFRSLREAIHWAWHDSKPVKLHTMTVTITDNEGNVVQHFKEKRSSRCN